MTDEARRRIEEIHREQRAKLRLNYLLIFTSTATVIMAMAMFFLSSRQEAAINVYVQEAQKTMKVACQAAEGELLPADVQESCNAAKRNELPSVLQSVVDHPDPNDPEKQDPEKQESEVQEPEQQDTEIPDGEVDDPDNNDPEDQEEEVQEEEVQEGEIQEPEMQEPEEQNAPACSPGYSQREFHWFGRDGVDNTGDEQDWQICIKD